MEVNHCYANCVLTLLPRSDGEARPIWAEPPADRRMANDNCPLEKVAKWLKSGYIRGLPVLWDSPPLHLLTPKPVFLQAFSICSSSTCRFMVFSLLRAEKIPKPRVSLHLVLALVPFLPPRSSFFFLISSLCSSSPLILFVRESSEAFFFSSPVSSLFREESWRTETCLRLKAKKVNRHGINKIGAQLVPPKVPKCLGLGG